ncbi:MAG: hypothetical protein JSS07_02360 [Proteobacteria bacterium]|nr:hypothetical protein [Pseudomonadota bacterium]
MKRRRFSKMLKLLDFLFHCPKRLKIFDALMGATLALAMCFSTWYALFLVTIVLSSCLMIRLELNPVTEGQGFLYRLNRGIILYAIGMGPFFSLLAAVSATAISPSIWGLMIALSLGAIAGRLSGNLIRRLFIPSLTNFMPLFSIKHPIKAPLLEIIFKSNPKSYSNSLIYIPMLSPKLKAFLHSKQLLEFTRETQDKQVLSTILNIAVRYQNLLLLDAVFSKRSDLHHDSEMLNLVIQRFGLYESLTLDSRFVQFDIGKPDFNPQAEIAIAKYLHEKGFNLNNVHLYQAINRDEKQTADLCLEVGASFVSSTYWPGHIAIRIANSTWQKFFKDHYQKLLQLDLDSPSTLKELAAKNLYSHLKGQECYEGVTLSTKLPTELLLYYKQVPIRARQRSADEANLAFYKANLRS